MTCLTDYISAGGWVMVLIVLISLSGWLAVLQSLHFSGRARCWINGVFSAFEPSIQPKQKFIADSFEDDRSMCRLIHHAWLGQSEIERARQWQRFLTVTAAVLPLLGLLGTVLGIIATFESLGGETVQTHRLAGGIRQALLTTQAGLVTALPLFWIARGVMKMVARLQVRVDEVFKEMNQRAQSVPEVMTTSRKIVSRLNRMEKTDVSISEKTKTIPQPDRDQSYAFN